MKKDNTYWDKTVPASLSSTFLNHQSRSHWQILEEVVQGSQCFLHDAGALFVQLIGTEGLEAHLWLSSQLANLFHSLIEGILVFCRCRLFWFGNQDCRQKDEGKKTRFNESAIEPHPKMQVVRPSWQVQIFNVALISKTLPKPDLDKTWQSFKEKEKFYALFSGP